MSIAQDSKPQRQRRPRRLAMAKAEAESKKPRRTYWRCTAIVGVNLFEIQIAQAPLSATGWTWFTDGQDWGGWIKLGPPASNA